MLFLIVKQELNQKEEGSLKIIAFLILALMDLFLGRNFWRNILFLWMIKMIIEK